MFGVFFFDLMAYLTTSFDHLYICGKVMLGKKHSTLFIRTQRRQNYLSKLFIDDSMFVVVRGYKK
jgi:hypothetical protein